MLAESAVQHHPTDTDQAEGLITKQIVDNFGRVPGYGNCKDHAPKEKAFADVSIPWR